MRDEARVIALAEWAARTNAETRAAMGVSVVPEECRDARAYLSELMTDEEAAACVAADLARVRDDLITACDQDDTSVVLIAADDDPWSAPGWRDAAVEYHKDRGNRVSIVEKTGGRCASRLMADAEYLVRENDPERLRIWLAKRSADERTAIQKHLGGKHGVKPATD